MMMHAKENEAIRPGIVRCRSLAAAVLAALAIGAPALGQAFLRKDYGPGGQWVGHKLKITTSNTVPMQVKMGYILSTHAETNKCVAPAVQPIGWKETLPLGVGPVGPFTKKTLLQPAWAEAKARGNVLTLIPGKVEADYFVAGTAFADNRGCHVPPAPPPWGRSYARAWSAANMKVQGGKLDRKGNIVFGGGWKFGQPVSAGTEARVGTDPIRARLIDHTTGLTVESVLVSFSAMVVGGDVAWESGVLSNTGHELLIDLNVPGVKTTQQGRLRLRVAAGTVTERTVTGMFAGMAIPPLGGGGVFSVPLPDLVLDYDLGGDPGHDLATEFTFESGAEADAAVDCVAITNGTLLTDIGIGFDGNNLSRVPMGDNLYGFNTGSGAFHVADDFTLFGGGNWLDGLRWPVYQINAPTTTPLTAAYVRVWLGTPGAGGVPVAGDMVTNRLIRSDFSECHRVSETAPTNARAIKDLVIDLTGIGPLSGGTYWIEVAAKGDPAYGSPFTPPSLWPQYSDNALVFSESSGAWAPLQDGLSGRPLDIPFTIMVDDHAPLCYPDCSANGSLTIADFGCFQTKFVTGDPYADCDQSGSFTVADFGCFQTSFLVGCP